jgi:hypothetical protein
MKLEPTKPSLKVQLEQWSQVGRIHLLPNRKKCWLPGPLLLRKSYMTRLRQEKQM